MKRVKFIAAIQSYVGALDSKEDAQANRQRLVSRFRPGTKGHQMYTMKMHEGPWAEGATRNRELLKTVQREAHAIENAFRHPEQASADLRAKAAIWQQRFADYKATKKPGDKQYATLFTYTYAHLLREIKAGNVLDYIRELKARKESTYQALIPQIQSLVAGETDIIANMANVAAALHEAFGFWWTGFYLVKANANAKELVLGPFQGPIACTRIPYNKGVCGTAWAQNRTLVVPNVHEFKGHIACSSASKSEIVVPIRRNNETTVPTEKEVIAVLDIDSTDYNTFDAIDQHYLEQIAEIIKNSTK